MKRKERKIPLGGYQPRAPTPSLAQLAFAFCLIPNKIQEFRERGSSQCIVAPSRESRSGAEESGAEGSGAEASDEAGKVCGWKGLWLQPH